MLNSTHVTARVTIVVSCWLLSACIATAAQPWDSPPLSADPAKIAEAAKKVEFSDDSDAEILVEQVFFQIDSDRKLTKRHHQVYRVATEDAAREWALLEARWSPWHEKRPAIKARVIHPDGKAFELDAATIAESADTQNDATLLHDRRILQAPLPAMKAGCVVEYEMIWEESQPFFAAGTFERFVTTNYSPVHQARIVIKAPEALPLRYRFVGSDVKPTEEVKDGLRNVLFEVGDQPKYSSVEPHQGRESHPFSYVAFSTGESWQGIAASYADIVQSRIDVEAVRTMVESTLEGDESAKEAATKLLDLMRKLVRYTGLEFGSSAIIPYRPEQTLKRRYGDCKDQATLLVSMLKAAGHDAHLALLNAGGQEDTLSELPGLGAFNHVIVYVPGDEDIWIDPTSPFTAPGELPLGDQGKLALIAVPETTKLVRTPKASFSENIDNEFTTIKLSTSGLVSVEQTVTKAGIFAAEMRRAYAESDMDAMKENWKSYGETTFESKELSSLDYTDPSDFSKPFEVTARFEDASWGVAHLNAALIALDPDSVFDVLPWYLRQEENNDEDAATYQRRRKTRLHFTQPHTRELKYRVEPPPGYVLQELPQSETVRVGSATFAQKYELDGQAVVATFRFTTGDCSLSPDEVTGLRHKISSLATDSEFGTWMISLGWDHEAYKLIVSGDLEAGIAKHQELVAKYSNDSVYRESYVRGLLDSGLGTEARRVAMNGVAALPEDAKAHATVGLSLMYDEVGREGRFGYDRSGAIKAYRKAIELAPENLVYRWNLAVLLESDRYGNRYATKEDLKEAAKIYEAMLDEAEPPSDPAVNLGFCLYYAEDYERLAKLAKESPTLPLELRLAATVINDSPQAAKQETTTLTAIPAERLQLFLQTAIVLERGRHYDLACEMYEAGMAKAANPQGLRAAIQVIRKLKRIDEFAATPDQPQYPVEQALMRVLRFGLVSDELSDLFVNGNTDSSPLAFFESQYRRTRLQGIQADSPVGRRLDVLSLMNYKVEGSDDTSYLVTVENNGLLVTEFAVVRTGNDAKPSYRILASGKNNSAIGTYALTLLSNDKNDVAWDLMDGAKQTLNSGRLFSPFSGAPFARLWKASTKGNPSELRVAAAVLAARDPTANENIAIIEAAVESEQSAFRKLQLQRALCEAYAAHKKFDKLLDLSSKLLNSSITSNETRSYQLDALRSLEKREALQTAADDWLKRESTATMPQSVLTELATDEGDFVQAYEIAKRMVDAPNPTSFAYNEAAWQAIFVDPMPEEALEFARKACDLDAFTRSASLHTLAMVLAEKGDIAEARRTLVQAIEARPLDKIESHDWLVLGRMSEHLGLVEAAKTLYGRVNTGSSKLLAERRLKNLP